MFVSAYPAHFILTIYLLLIMLIWSLAANKERASNIGRLKKTVKSHAIIIITFVLLSLPAIISYMAYLPLSARGSGASYERAMSNPLHPFFNLLPVSLTCIQRIAGACN